MSSKKQYKRYLTDRLAPLTYYARKKRKDRMTCDSGPESETAEDVGDIAEDDEVPGVSTEWISSSGEDQHATAENERYDLDQGEFETLQQEIHGDGDLSVGKLLVLLLAYAKRHRLSRRATEDLFRVVKVTLPPATASLLPHSWHLFDRIMEDHIPYYSVHYYCPEHLVYLGSDLANNVCPVDGKEIHEDELRAACFVTLAMKDTLALLLESFAAVCESHVKEMDFQPTLPSGGLYHSTRNHFGMRSTDFTVTVHSDGAALRKTKWANKQSCHIVQLSVNELPPSFRHRNILLHTIYCGSKSLPTDTLLTPLLNEFNDISTSSPIKWRFNGKEISSRVFCLKVVSDTAERYHLLNTKIFGAYYGCTTCIQKGTVCGCVHVFEHIPLPEIRQHESLVRMGQDAAGMDAKEQQQMQDVLQGVVGPSVFSRLVPPTVNLPRGMPSDFYHLFPEGVMSKLLRFWIAGSHLNVAEADQRLMEIQPNGQAKRLPRDLLQNAKFQGHELLHLLLFYGFPVFQGLLPKTMYDNFCRLAAVAHASLDDNVLAANLILIDQQMTQFCAEFQKLYGLRQMSSNVHQLRHLAMHLEDWGPAWEFWTLYFESALGYRTRRVCGTQHTAKEIARTAALDLAVSVLQRKSRDTGNPDFEVLLNSISHPQHSKNAIRVSTAESLGSVACLQGNVIDFRILLARFPILARMVTEVLPNGNPYDWSFAFKCIVESGFVAVSDEAQGNSERNSRCAFVDSGHLLKVRLFMTDRKNVYVIGEFFELDTYTFSEVISDFHFAYQIQRSLGLGHVATKNVRFSAVETRMSGNVNVYFRSPNCLNYDI